MSNNDTTNNRGGPIIAAAVLLLLLVGYVGAYFGLSKFATGGIAGEVSIRAFKDKRQVEFFWPALKIEKRCRGDLWAAWSDSGVVNWDVVE